MLQVTHEFRKGCHCPHCVGTEVLQKRAAFERLLEACENFVERFVYLEEDGPGSCNDFRGEFEEARVAVENAKELM